MSWFSRSWGLAIDNLVGMLRKQIYNVIMSRHINDFFNDIKLVFFSLIFVEIGIVLPNGEHHFVNDNATQFSDLWWALRGGIYYILSVLIF